MAARKKTQFQPMKIGVTKLEIEPGDTLVFKTDLFLSADQVRQLRNIIKAQIPKKTKFMLLCGGLSLSVMRKSKKQNYGG